MRSLTIFLATLQILFLLVTAHPFVIVNTRVTEVHAVQSPRPTRHYERRQGILDNIESGINSIFGISDQTTSTLKASSTKSAVTIPPPAIASTTSSSDASQTTSTQDADDDDDNEQESTTSSNEESSSTVSEVSTTTTDSSATVLSTSTTSSSSTTSAIPVASPTLGDAQATATSTASKSDNNNSDGVPPGGIAVAVIMSLVIVAVTAWLIFKYHPRCQAWWAARQEKKFQERSFRDALDSPTARSPNLRQQALGTGGAASKRQTLKSFFAPATAKLGQGREIKRKPVNWGVESPTTAGTVDSEKISMTAAAAPMGQIERYSLMPQTSTPVAQAVSPVSLRPRESLENMPPVSPLSAFRELPPISSVQAQRDLPPLPPVPVLPSLVHAKRGSDGVFRLA